MSPSKNLDKEQNEGIVAAGSSKPIGKLIRDGMQEDPREDGCYPARIRGEKEVVAGIESEFKGESGVLGESVGQELMSMDVWIWVYGYCRSNCSDSH